MNRELPFHSSDEDRVAAEMARELEAMTMTTSAQPSEGFADRVMLAVADEPLPQPVRAFGLALLGGHLRAAGAAISDAWRTVSSAPAPLFVRAQALALVLVVLVSSLAVAGGATVGALGLLSNVPPIPAPSGPAPTLVIPTPSLSPEPDESPGESEGVEPSETPEASDAADPSETPDAQETERATIRPRTPGPTTTPHETFDNGGDSGSGGGGGETPQPTETVDPSGGDG